MPSNHHVIGATVVAVLALSTAMLITSHEHDLARTAGAIGFVVGTIIGIGSAIYDLIERRIDRMEQATNRVIRIETDVLKALRGDGGLN